MKVFTMNTSKMIEETIIDSAHLYVQVVVSVDLDYQYLSQYMGNEKDVIKKQIFNHLFESNRNAQTISKFFVLISELAFSHNPNFFIEDGLDNSDSLYSYMMEELLKSEEVQNYLEHHYTILISFF